MPGEEKTVWRGAAGEIREESARLACGAKLAYQLAASAYTAYRQ